MRVKFIGKAVKGLFIKDNEYKVIKEMRDGFIVKGEDGQIEEWMKEDFEVIEI